MINVTERTRACSTQTLSYASGRVLVRLNTCGLLKRATLERKKSAGGESNERSTSSNHATPLACILGTFSHATCFPISFVLQTRFLDRSVFSPLAPLGFA